MCIRDRTLSSRRHHQWPLCTGCPTATGRHHHGPTQTIGPRLPPSGSSTHALGMVRLRVHPTDTDLQNKTTYQIWIHKDSSRQGILVPSGRPVHTRDYPRWACHLWQQTYTQDHLGLPSDHKTTVSFHNSIHDGGSIDSRGPLPLQPNWTLSTTTNRINGRPGLAKLYSITHVLKWKVNAIIFNNSANHLQSFMYKQTFTNANLTITLCYNLTHMSVWTITSTTWTDNDFSHAHDIFQFTLQNNCPRIPTHEHTWLHGYIPRQASLLMSHNCLSFTMCNNLYFAAA